MKKKELEPDLISIIVLVYNTQKYVTKCLNSILNQTYQNIEVIVIDDGSTDLSNSLIKRKMKRDNRITLIEHENKGTYLSRLEGYKKACGKYLMYVDSDDYILKDTIEIMHNNLKEYNVDIVHCQYKMIKNNKIVTPKNILNRNVVMHMEHLEPQFFDLLYKTSHCDSICRQLIKKRGVMKNVNKIESALNYREDLACNLKIYKEMKSFLFIPDELYVYNDNLEGLTHSKDADILKKKVEDTIYVYYELYKSVKDFNIKDKKYYKKMASIKMFYYLSMMLNNLIKYSNLSKKELLNYMNEVMDCKKVKEIKKFLLKNDFSELKSHNRLMYKYCHTLLENKLDKFYFQTKYLYRFIIKEEI